LKRLLVANQRRRSLVGRIPVDLVVAVAENAAAPAICIASERRLADPKRCAP